MTGTAVRVLLAALLLCAGPARAQTATPAELYGPLFRAVQLGRVFPDNKTFVDAVPKRPVAAILADYARDRPADPAALRAFVLANFTVPGVNDVAASPLRAHIRALWPVLTRPPLTPAPGSSALALPRPYVVPGGRFREIYYWDSYFTLLGLKADGEDALVEAMLDDFTSLIERYGHIPNGTRSYYLSRSQPPFFALMLDLSTNRDPAVAARRLRALRREYAFWMRGQTCLGAEGACAHVVRMPDGALLNRYWDAKDVPRDESFAEDVATAETAPDATRLWRDLRSAAESGWDFSSRWLADPQRLASIQTTAIVPVDLNSLLYAMEQRIAARCRAAGDGACATRFTQAAARRKAAIDRYLWLAVRGWYADWDRARRAPSPRLSAATLYPLFAGLAAPAQAKAVAATVRARLLAPGGLRTTEVATGQQWDRPNGWAPLQWIAIDGLARAGEAPLARAIAERWLATVNAAFVETGKMLEKYDVEERRPGGGGEYPLQDGFGWTNGVASALLERYPELAPPPAP
ncbi:MAG: alpha,alpha-trehalase TreF [Sphingomonas sp.]|nr:alpha,alpha-trehalase TreF [Sphingomonas sp.]